MNRRDLFRRLVGAATTAAAPMGTVERPLVLVSPHCPRCGWAAFYTRRSAGVGDVVPVQCPNPSCGWTGATPMMVKATS